MTFSKALKLLKKGKCICRGNWIANDMFLYLVNGSEFTVNREPLISILPEGTKVNYHAHIDMKTDQGDYVPWVASQTDLLANDWIVLG